MRKTQVSKKLDVYFCYTLYIQFTNSTIASVLHDLPLIFAVEYMTLWRIFYRDRVAVNINLIAWKSALFLSVNIHLNNGGKLAVFKSLLAIVRT